MSTVKADNFTWKTGEATAQSGSTVTGPQIVYGVAKSWCNFNGVSGATSRASFNISSLTRATTGQYYLSATTSFQDANYSLLVSGGNSSGGAIVYSTDQSGGTRTSSVIGGNINMATGGMSGVDTTYMQIAVFR